MNDVAFFRAVKSSIFLSAVALVLLAIAGCGFSYNTNAEKGADLSAPFVTCSANPSSVVSGSTVLISTKSISPLGLPLTYSYAATEGSVSSQGTSATLYTQDAAGNVTVTCKVVDTKGNASSFTTAVDVQAAPSQPPPTISCSATPATVTVGGSVAITAVASSPEGRPLSYSWAASAGTIAGSGNSATLNTNGAAAGTIQVTCKVADDQGRSASAATSVTVVAPVSMPPPSITCSANPSTVTLGGNVTITATASSPEGLPLTYSWSASSGTITGSGSTATLNTSSAAAGTIIVTCKVADDQGRSASATTAVIVEAAPASAPPTIICSANPSTVTLGGSVTITAAASSPEGLPLTYSWSASSGIIAGSGSTATLNTSSAAAGTIIVTCKVADNQGRSASATTAVIVKAAPASAPPTISCSANPSTVTLGGSVMITATASSPEGLPLTYSWGASSGTIAGAGNTATLNTSGAAAGTLTVTCKVADDQGRSASTTTPVIVNAVAPTPPTISCSANPTIINQGAAVTITATGSSPQNLPLTYSYSASAGSISGTAATETLETSGASAGIITVTCTVDQQGGGTASATINVLLQSVTGEQALSNFQFTDSVGVNVHLSYGDEVWGAQFPQIMQSMINLGIKHYRDGLNQYAPAFQYQNNEMLGKAGLKAEWLMDINNSATVINSAYANAPDATGGFEGPNEDDANVGPQLLAFMQLLNGTVRGNPATAAMPIVAPSFKELPSFGIQGDLSSVVNYGNTHDYFGTYNPETAPYGGSFYDCGGYGSMQFNICLAQMVAVNEPVVSTETGYQSGQGLSDAVIGRYELRTLFESLRLGIVRTFLYELIDDPSGTYGLLTGTFAPKPAYTAIQNVLSLLKDVSFAQPGKLDYTLSGQTQNVHQVLLQKSDGSFYLAIWLAVQSANPFNPSETYDVPSQAVTLQSNTPVGGATTYILDDNGNLTSSSTELTNGSLSVAVTDRITLVALSPGQSH